eukprot:1497457-Amphidinium_carterae.1
MGIEAVFDIHVAMELCVELGNFCEGIVCSHAPHGPACQVQAPSSEKGTPSSTTAYVKDCPVVTAEDCKEVPQLLEPLKEKRLDLHGAAVIVLAHSRGKDLKECLKGLLSQSDVELFDVIVSLDDLQTAEVMREVAAQAAKDFSKDVKIWMVESRVPDATKHNEAQIKWFQTNTGKIAHHYWTCFERAFREEGYEYAIFVEEDLLFSPDFLALFRSTAWLVEQDESVWCISAWNDY